MNGDVTRWSPIPAHSRTGRRLTFGLEVAESFDRNQRRSRQRSMSAMSRGDLRTTACIHEATSSCRYRCDQCGVGRPLPRRRGHGNTRVQGATGDRLHRSHPSRRVSVVDPREAGCPCRLATPAAALAICYALNIPVPARLGILMASSATRVHGAMEHIHAAGCDMVVGVREEPDVVQHHVAHTRPGR